MNKVLIKLAVPKKDLSERWEQIPPRESQPYKERGCVRPVMALPEGLSLGQKVRKDALIANPEEFGAIGTMSPPQCRADPQGILGAINHGTKSL